MPKSTVAADARVASAAEGLGLPRGSAEQLAQMAAQRKQQRQQHRARVTELQQQVEEIQRPRKGAEGREDDGDHGFGRCWAAVGTSTTAARAAKPGRKWGEL